MSAATTEAPPAAAAATVTAVPIASNLATGTITSGTAGPAGPTGIPETDLPTCTSDNVGPSPPFCQPRNGTRLISGKSYYVTWDQALFENDEDVEIVLNYGTARDDSTTYPLHRSSRVPQSWGYYVLPIETNWLDGQAGNETMITFKMNSYKPNIQKVSQNYTGPSVSVVSPSPSDMPQAPSTPNNTTGLAAGLTVGLIIFIALLVGFCVWSRRKSGGFGGIFGSKVGYGTRQSRGQRMKGGHDAQREEVSHDRDVELDQRGGNAFREEIARQQTGH